MADIRALLGDPPAPWTIVAERKIEQWIKDGGPDRLSNKGQPLDLTENPFVAPELRMAYHVLKNAEMAPDWIEIGKEVENLLSTCREEARRFRYARHQDRLRRAVIGGEALERLADTMASHAERFVGDQRSRLTQANHLIDRFNRACPVVMLHRARLDIDAEITAAIDGA